MLCWLLQFMNFSGGLDGESEPPAFQRAQHERMEKEYAEKNAVDPSCDHMAIQGQNSNYIKVATTILSLFKWYFNSTGIWRYFKIYIYHFRSDLCTCAFLELHFHAKSGGPSSTQLYSHAKSGGTDTYARSRTHTHTCLCAHYWSSIHVGS